MVNKPDRIELSYQKHIDGEKTKNIKMLLPSCYVNPDCIDAWRHKRFHSFLDGVLETDRGASWLTLGDGSYGSDAYYLNSKGGHATASSISDNTISIAIDKGYIPRGKAINAENIAEEDSSYDYILCKEAYHHFPRPPVAFYEMLRVAKKGIVLIEPQESRPKLLDILKNFFKTKVRGDTTLYFESSGNYIYRLDIRNVEKMLISMNFENFAYKRFNDFYMSGLGNKTSKQGSSIFLTRLGIAIQNLLCRCKLLDYGLIMVVVFKNKINQDMLTRLNNDGFKVVTLPVNPYI